MHLCSQVCLLYLQLRVNGSSNLSGYRIPWIVYALVHSVCLHFATFEGISCWQQHKIMWVIASSFKAAECVLQNYNVINIGVELSCMSDSHRFYQRKTKSVPVKPESTNSLTWSGSIFTWLRPLIKYQCCMFLVQQIHCSTSVEQQRVLHSFLRGKASVFKRDYSILKLDLEAPLQMADKSPEPHRVLQCF